MEKGTFQNLELTAYLMVKSGNLSPRDLEQGMVVTLTVPNEHCTEVLPGEIIEIKEKERKVI